MSCENIIFFGMLKNYYKANVFEAGCDEVGRGCLAGPVVAAAVILGEKNTIKGLNDSKKLSLKTRLALAKEIKQKAISYAVAEVSNEDVDKINVLNASFLAMHRALEKLSQQPEFILVDGNRFKPYKNIEYECVIKGDGKYASIAAASILAKTYRDQLMIDLAKEYPGYYWENNVGYPTKAHRQAIKELGVTRLHRKSFQLLPRQIELF